MRQWTYLVCGGVTVWWVAALVLVLTSCARGDVEGDETVSAGSEIPTRCMVSQFSRPVLAGTSYAAPVTRRFLEPVNHLGVDIPLAEDTPIYSLGCGVVRFAGPAQGYGTLVIVLEHALAVAVPVTNAAGTMVNVTRFLSIYGHLRAVSSRGGGRILRVGDEIGGGELLGYVQNDLLNGDGAEHLHLGIRLQSASDARRSDPTAWFRGYDGTPSQKRFFADPLVFIGEDAMPPVVSMRPPPSEVAMDAGAQPVMPRPVPTTPVDAGASSQDVVTMQVFDAGSVTVTPDVPAPTASFGYRYELRVSSALPWRVSEPIRLRNQWWQMQTCRNTGSPVWERRTDGWWRCETAEQISPFDASIFLPDHTDWGDQGQIGTVANTPTRCSPQPGIFWRLTNLARGRTVYEGEVRGLPCVGVGSQDRLRWPE